MTPRDVLEKYVDDVIERRIPACAHAIAACRRHRKDIDDGKFHFSDEVLDRVIRFCGLLTHWQGPSAGSPFIPEPWQVFILGSIFAWIRDDGTRRYRYAYIEVPRKNGKTFLASAIVLYATYLDGEQGAQAYIAATKMAQAMIAFKDCENMIKKSNALRDRAKVTRSSILIPRSASVIYPLGRDADRHDGFNVHLGLIDEYHAHPNSELYDVLVSGTGARKQPLMVVITTAGDSIGGACHQMHEMCAGLLKGDIHNDENFAIIHTIDEGDDWKDPATWAKANPNLGVSIDEKQFESLVNQAKMTVANERNFLTKNLNVWIGGGSSWIATDAFIPLPCDAPTSIEEWAARRDEYSISTIGVDLSSTTDLTGISITGIHKATGHIHAMTTCYMPEDTAKARGTQDGVDYFHWARQGWLVMTPGKAIDMLRIRKDIFDAAVSCRARVGVDPWGSRELTAWLMTAGVEVYQVRQGVATLSTPTKAFEQRVLSKTIDIGGNPMIPWMAANAALVIDDNGNLKITKRKSTKRIDGLAALINGLAVIEAFNAGPSTQSNAPATADGYLV
jgi:phage terminase large subunit-like protein